MAQLKLLNRSGKIINEGDLVKNHTQFPNSFLNANPGDSGIIGTASQKIGRGAWGTINGVNTVNWNDVMNKPSTFNSNTTSTSSGNSYFPSGW
jgi:hypothetical protein